MIIFFYFFYFCGIWAFSSSRKHLLITLLRLEYVVLILCFSIYFYMCVDLITVYVLLCFYLVFSVCEGSLGLSILVSIIRSHSHDCFQSYSILQY